MGSRKEWLETDVIRVLLYGPSQIEDRVGYFAGEILIFFDVKLPCSYYLNCQHSWVIYLPKETVFDLRKHAYKEWYQV